MHLYGFGMYIVFSLYGKVTGLPMKTEGRGMNGKKKTPKSRLDWKQILSFMVPETGNNTKANESPPGEPRGVARKSSSFIAVSCGDLHP